MSSSISDALARRRAGLLSVAALGLTLGLALAVPAAQAIEVQAREAIIVEATTGTVLLEKDSDVLVPPASMSKIMTVYMLFKHIKDGRLSLDDELPVSEKAWRMGGSKMFVEVGTQVAVRDLLRGIIVQSGNDACIVVAEALSGSEEAFAEDITELGREIGLTDSTFANATGWPHPNHRVTARDLATLAQRTIEDFPELYKIYSETEFTYHDIRQGNRNPLLYKALGADGLKTGHTNEAGYGLTASATRGDRRVILVIGGMPSAKARAEEAERLLGWAFREFKTYNLFEAGETVESADVWQGTRATVPLVVPDEVRITMTRDARKGMTVKARFEEPVPTPIQEGQELGSLIVESEAGEPKTFPLLAGASVERLGLVARLWSSVKYMVFESGLPQ